MGTRFLMTRESPVPAVTAERYLAAGLGDVIVTNEIDGLPQRVIVNELVRRLEGGRRIAPALERAAQRPRLSQDQRRHAGRAAALGGSRCARTSG